MMANARPGSPLWEVAGRTTDASNDDDGVALALRAMEARGELATCAPRAVRRADASDPSAAPSGARVTVRRAAAEEVVDLRERVLWPGRPEMCRLAEDAAPEAVHLVAVADDDGVGDGVGSGDGGAAALGVLSLFLPRRPECGTAEEPCGRAQFRKLAVDPTCRGRGIGRTLVDVAAAEARTAGAATLFCHAREPQAGFYELQGFERCGEPFRKYEGGDMYVEMEAAL